MKIMVIIIFLEQILNPVMLVEKKNEKDENN